jgi:fatty acid desaturase
MSRHSAGTGPGRAAREPDDVSAPAGPPRRKRVVLADSRAPVTVLRTVVELEEQTSYGEELVRGLIRTQLKTALRLAFLAVMLLCGLPVLFFFVPAIAEVTVAGVRLPWLLLGVAPFPVLFGIGYWYNVVAERHERDFVDMVEK